MLIEFSVSNFRSFAEKQTITMEASKPKASALYSVIETGFKKTPYVYKVGAILGANASGKSNMIKAMEFFQELIQESTDLDNFNGSKTFSFERNYFKLDPKYKQLDTEFNIVFIAPFEDTNGLYSYSVSINETSIVKEVLTVIPQTTGRERLLIDKEKQYFHKNMKVNINNYDEILDNHLLFTYINRKTKNQYLSQAFISVAIKKRIFLDNKITPQLTSDMILDDDLEQISKQKIVDFMIGSSINVKNIAIKKEERDLSSIKDLEFLEFIKKTPLSYNMNITYFKEDVYGKQIPFSLEDDESTGTNILYSLSAVILLALENGETLIIDELDSNMHPRLVQYIVALFEDNNVNTKNAQLLITTHSSNILDLGLNAEQFFITELKEDFSTEIYSIGDFKSTHAKSDRNDRLSRKYIKGLFGGVPIFTSLTIDRNNNQNTKQKIHNKLGNTNG